MNIRLSPAPVSLIATHFDANSFTDQNISAVNRIATEISNIASRLTDLSLNAKNGSHRQRQRRF
jgi:antitoxin component HigA of HigAB toxin-antitoxin module